MEIGELSDYLVDIYKANTQGLFSPVAKKSIAINGSGGILLLGPPGIGKTTGVSEAGQKINELLKREFLVYNDSLYRQIAADPTKYFLHVELNLNDQEPSDLTGIPKETDEGISYKPFLWAKALSLSGITGILCLDEFTNIQRLDVVTASYKIVLDHLVGFTKLSNNIMVVATGNSPEESTVANLLPCPLVDRFTIYRVKQPKIPGWANWMDKHCGEEWDKRTLGYLMHFTDEFLNLPMETETLTNFPTPRSWTKIALLLPQINNSRWRETIEGQLGPTTGTKFFSFLNTEIPSVEELLRNPEKFEQIKELDGKYLASVLIGAYIRNRFKEQKEEKKQEEEIEKTLPLIQVMKNVQQDLIILTIISGGDMKDDITLALGRKDKEIAKILKDVAILRTNLEV